MEVLSNEIYSPQNFIELLTDKVYIMGNNPTKDIYIILFKHSVQTGNFVFISDYALSAIDEMIARKALVVLVDVSGFDQNGKWVQEYRWFEVPARYHKKFKNENI